MANEPIKGTAVYLQPGMSIEISAPTNTRDHFGWFAATQPPQTFFDDLPNSSYKRDVENADVGEIKESPDSDGAAIKYTHKVGVENAIWFFSIFEQIGVVKVIAVPIHDHSSIVQGGPAYGTYFDDDEEAAS
jgi:hypothetical protein